MLTAILDQLEPPHAPVSVTSHVLLARSDDTSFRLFNLEERGIRPERVCIFFTNASWDPAAFGFLQTEQAGIF